jgi:hypothetical protein
MIFRSSQVSEAKRCVAKAFYKYELGLVKKGEKVNSDLFFGKAVHKGVELSLTQSLEDAVDYLEGLLWPPGRTKSKQTALCLVRQFYHKFDYELISSEEYFTFPIDEDVWKGKFDLVAKKDGELTLIELKTTNPYYLVTKPVDQFISYYIGAKEKYGAKQFVLCNLDPNSINVSFTRVRYSDDEISEWMVEFAYWKDFYKKCVTDKIIPRTSGACYDYNRQCEYYDICISNPEIRKKVINNCYDISEAQKELEW